MKICEYIRDFLRKKQEYETAIEEEKRLVLEDKQKCRDWLYEMQLQILTLQPTLRLKQLKEFQKKWNETGGLKKKKKQANGKK